MKKFIFALFSILFSISSFAQLNGNGYYRVKNVASERYITVIDNRGSINIGTTSADLGAVRLYKGFDNVVSDPASILYIEETASGYKFYAQGTDTYEIIGYYLKLRALADNKYMAYQSASGLTMYLGDPEKSSVVDAPLGTNAKGDYNKWYILPVDDAGSNYFGFTPEVKCGGSYYASFYASFPFNKVSKDLKFYYVSMVSNGMAVYKELSGASVPASTPIIVKCPSDKPSANKVDIVTNQASAPSDNLLGGVYFCNESNDGHRNVVAYDPATMRILGVMSTGELGYIKADIDYLPANRSYLKVPAGSPDEIKLVSYDEYVASIPKSYVVTFKIGDEIISSETMLSGTPIVPPAAPDKEGHTFNGWGDVDATVPNHDVTYEGSYSVNSYRIIYVVDGLVYRTDTIQYGTAITLADAPEKEGHTFIEWIGALEVMPAYNMKLTAKYSVNRYKVYYYVENTLVKTQNVMYGDAIPSYVYVPTSPDVTFLGWIGEVYDTMPAHDVTYTANIANDIRELTSNRLVDVYTIMGVKVMTDVRVEDVMHLLKRGIYIIDGKKVVVE